MQIDFERFKGSLPYASELFGIYQPLLGWKSTMTMGRMARNKADALRNFSERALSRTKANVLVKYENGILTVDNLRVSDIVQTQYVIRVPLEIDAIVARFVAARLPIDRPPTEGGRKNFLDRDWLDEQLQVAKSILESFVLRDRVPPEATTEMLKYIQTMRGADRQDRSPEQIIKWLLDREVAVASYLLWLRDNQVTTLEMLFYRRATDPFGDIAFMERDPLAMIGTAGLEAVLSPIGVVHLF